MNTQIKYYFSIPESETVRSLNGAMLMTLKAHPEWFYDDFKIDSVYGCPRSCIWNGNREFQNMSQCSIEEVENIIQAYQDFGVTFRLTFTNFMLEEKHLGDEYGNAIAYVVEKHKGMAIVSTPMMYDFIREKYPGLDVSWSTTTDFGNTAEERVAKINELSRERVVVVPYDMNNKPILMQLQHPENIEVLVNETCIDDCPRRREHWKKCCLMNMGILEGKQSCLMRQYRGTDRWKMHSMVNRKGLSKYVERGINRFKFSGRTELGQTYFAYTRYLVKQEHQRDFYSEVNDIWWKLRLEAGMERKDVYSSKEWLLDEYDYAESQAEMGAVEMLGAENDAMW